MKKKIKVIIIISIKEKIEKEKLLLNEEKWFRIEKGIKKWNYMLKNI
jgi:hypothetical protein